MQIGSYKNQILTLNKMIYVNDSSEKKTKISHWNSIKIDLIRNFNLLYKTAIRNLLPPWCFDLVFVKLHHILFIDGRMPNTWNLAQVLRTLYRFKILLKNLYSLLSFLPTSTFLTKILHFCIFSVLLYFLYYLYYFLSRLTQLPFYSWFEMRQVASRTSNDVK